MAVYIEIKRKWEGFSIELQVKSSAKRIGILGLPAAGRA